MFRYDTQMMKRIINVSCLSHFAHRFASVLFSGICKFHILFIFPTETNKAVAVYVARGSAAVEKTLFFFHVCHCCSIVWCPVRNCDFNENKNCFFFFSEFRSKAIWSSLPHTARVVSAHIYSPFRNDNQNKHVHIPYASFASSHIFGGRLRVNTLSPNAMLIGEPIVSKRLGRPKSLHLRPKTYHPPSTTRYIRCDFFFSSFVRPFR